MYKEPEPFSLKKRIHGTTHGLRGVGILLKHGHNIWLFLFFGVLAAYLGWILNISAMEWIVVILIFIIIMSLEAVNTAIEIDMDLTSPDYHPFARDTKDVAAAAVLIAVFFGGIASMIIFVPKILGPFLK